MVFSLLFSFEKDQIYFLCSTGRAAVHAQYFEFVVHDMNRLVLSLKTVSSAKIPGTETYLRDITGKNRMVGSYGLCYVNYQLGSVYQN